MMLEKIKETVKKYEGKVLDLRRHFHMHPEISWNEKETTKRVAKELEEMGISIIKVGFGGTECGVLAEIKGGKPGKTVALRADMDALPLTEEVESPFKSKNDGVMHACGHDAHTAMLVGAAAVLQEHRQDLKGNVRLIFQPAEEHGRIPGAQAMIDGGALDGVDAVFGLHIMPNLEVGKIQYALGPIMAAADAWHLTVKGKGGHGSAPETAVDPTIGAAHTIAALQTLVSREIPPQDTAVVSVGGIKSSSHVFNIIPDRVEITGSVRTFNPKVQDAVEEGMARIARNSCEAHRCVADFKYERFLPATINNDAAAELVKNTAIKALGAENVEKTAPLMGSEDFSMFLNKVPGAFFFLGVGNKKKGITYPYHSPLFDLDEDALAIGVRLHSGLVMAYLDQE